MNCPLFLGCFGPCLGQRLAADLLSGQVDGSALCQEFPEFLDGGFCAGQLSPACGVCILGRLKRRGQGFGLVPQRGQRCLCGLCVGVLEFRLQRGELALNFLLTAGCPRQFLPNLLDILFQRLQGLLLLWNQMFQLLLARQAALHLLEPAL